MSRLRSPHPTLPPGALATTLLPALVLLLVVAGLAVQTALLPVLAQAGLFWTALVPNLCLLVVLAVGLRYDATAGALTGFGVGLLLDLAPPADHTAGRWALALLLAGLLAGRLADQLRGGTAAPHRARVAAVVAGCSFVATSTSALTGRLLGDLDAAVPGLLVVIGLALVADTVAGVLLLPGLLRLLLALPAPQVEAPLR